MPDNRSQTLARSYSLPAGRSFGLVLGRLALLVLPAFALALDYGELSAQPQRWPREVTVRVPVTVPIVSGGQAAGSMQLPAGRTFRLLKVEPTAVTLDSNGARIVVRPSETDLMQRVLSRMGGAAPGVAPTAPPPPPPTVAATPPPVNAPGVAPTAVSTPVPTAAPPPTAAASGNAPPPSAGAAATSGGLPTRPGWHRRLNLPVSKAAKPVPGLEANSTGGDSFDLYVPKTYDPAKPAALLVFIPSSDKHILPEQYEALFDEFGVIALGPHRGGNSESFARRGGLALALARHAQANYRIDPARTLVGGNSGGGRVATRVGQMCADVFSGVVALSSADFHKEVILKDQSNDVVRTLTGFAASPTNAKGVPVTAGQIAMSRTRVRFALMGGTEDNVAKGLPEVSETFRRDGFKVVLIQQPGLDHRPVDPPYFRRGLVFALTGKTE